MESGTIDTPLARAIRETPDIEKRPDLILRMVDLLFLVAESSRPVPS